MNRKTKLLIISGIFIILIGFLVGVIVVCKHFFSQIEPILNNLPSGEKPIVQQEERIEIPPEEGVKVSDQLYDVLGIVTAIEKDMFIVTTNQQEEVKVYITPKTELYRCIISKKDSQIIFESQKKISFSQLKKGDEVQVITNENPEEETEIYALKVRAIERNF